MYVNFHKLKTVSTSGGIVAHVSGTSATSESVSVTEKISEDNEEGEIKNTLTGSEHPKLSKTFTVY